LIDFHQILGTELFFDYDGSNVLSKKFAWILATQEVPQNDFFKEVERQAWTIKVKVINKLFEFPTYQKRLIPLA